MKFAELIIDEAIVGLLGCKLQQNLCIRQSDALSAV